MDGLGGVFGLEEEELGHDDVGSVVGNWAVDANDALFEEPGEDIVGPFAARGVLNHHRDQTVVPNLAEIGDTRVRNEGFLEI